jgi:4'-phosphopantetheinyl transferase
MHESLKISRIFWLTQRLADVLEHDDWLSPRERGLLAQMKFPKRRSEWRLGRWTVKCALVHVLRKESHASLTEHSFARRIAEVNRVRFDELSRIEIRAAADGAPEAFMDEKPLPLAISISHRNDIGFCVISPSGIRLGCDVEAIEPRSDVFVADYFTPHEQEIVRRAADAERFWITTLIWSAKESALKALRHGLRMDTRWVEVELPSDAEEHHRAGDWYSFTVCHARGQQSFLGWWRRWGEFVLTIIAAGIPDRGRICFSIYSFGH